MFISVDLPAPFSPSSAWTSLRRRSKLTSSFATIPGKRFVMWRISSTVWGASGIEARFYGSRRPMASGAGFAPAERERAGRRPALSGRSRIPVAASR